MSVFRAYARDDASRARHQLLARDAVTCITSATSRRSSGLMGIAYIFLGMFTDKLQRGLREPTHDLWRFVRGHVLELRRHRARRPGNYSWAASNLGSERKWGLLIVIWIALILHARWGGMVKHRGIAVLSVWASSSVMVVVRHEFPRRGLHSYGFRRDDGVAYHDRHGFPGDRGVSWCPRICAKARRRHRQGATRHEQFDRHFDSPFAREDIGCGAQTGNASANPHLLRDFRYNGYGIS